MKTALMLALSLLNGALLRDANAQYVGGYVGGGVVLVPSGPNPAINYAVDRYNETRSWLDDEMDPIQSHMGYSFTLGAILLNFGMEMEYASYSSGTSEASGVQPASGTRGKRTLWTEQGVFAINMYYLLEEPGESDAPFYHGPGFGFDFASVSAYSAVGDGEGYDYADELNMYINLFYQFYFVIADDWDEPIFAIDARPFYSFGLIGEDYYPLNKAINSATYAGDDMDKLYDSFSNLGVKARLVYFF
jgi:hypothetical protein